MAGKASRRLRFDARVCTFLEYVKSDPCASQHSRRLHSSDLSPRDSGARLTRREDLLSQKHRFKDDKKGLLSLLWGHAGSTVAAKPYPPGPRNDNTRLQNAFLKETLTFGNFVHARQRQRTQTRAMNTEWDFPASFRKSKSRKDQTLPPCGGALHTMRRSLQPRLNLLALPRRGGQISCPARMRLTHQVYLTVARYSPEPLARRRRCPEEKTATTRKAQENPPSLNSLLSATLYTSCSSPG